MNLTHGEAFAGISGFGTGFQDAGIETLWHIEIDKKCQEVLRCHYPGNLIVSDIKEAGKHSLPYVDIISGGFPCQGLSIAGLRQGLADERSGLFFEMLRLIYELQPAYAIWENVPGLLSSCSCKACRRRCARCGTIAGADDGMCDVCGSDGFSGRVLPKHQGADFFTVISSFGFIGYDGAWTLLDAQYFGVAQRRRRLFGVFAQGHIGVERCAEILSFTNRMPGNFEAGEKTGARNTSPLKASPPGRRNRGSDPVADEFVVARPLAHSRTVDHHDESQQTYISFAHQSGGNTGLNIKNDLSGTLQENQTMAIAYGGNDTKGPVSVATSCNAHGSGRYDFESETFVIPFDTTTITCPSSRSNPQSGDPCHTLQESAHPPHIASTLNSGGNDGGFRTEPGEHLVVDALNAHSKRHGHGLTTQQAAEANHLITETLTSSGDARSGYRDEKGLITSGSRHSCGVRRLTPTECERLQGFPDGHTKFGLDEDGKEVKMSDSARYRQLGKAVCRTVARWIGQRIVANQED